MDEETCCICLSPWQNPVILRCHHILCHSCCQLLVEAQNLRCPLCRSALNITHANQLPHYQVPSAPPLESSSSSGHYPNVQARRAGVIQATEVVLRVMGSVKWRHTLSQVLQSGTITGGAAITGGLLAGPLGALLGGIFGSLFAYGKSENYDSLLSSIAALPFREQARLAYGIQVLLQSTSNGSSSNSSSSSSSSQYYSQADLEQWLNAQSENPSLFLRALRRCVNG